MPAPDRVAADRSTIPAAPILVVDDDAKIVRLVRTYLERDGFTVVTAADGPAALQAIESHQPALVVLDLMLPELDGRAVIRAVRRDAEAAHTPILVLSARSSTIDRIAGLEDGADDYLPKPFELSMLLARLNALLRRREWFHRDRTQDQTDRTTTEEALTDPEDAAREEFVFNNRVIDFDNLELRTPLQTIRLTLMEAQLLRYLVKHEGKVVSRKAILEKVWGLNEDTDTRAIDNFIVRLRKYIEDDPTKPAHLLTVRSVGYRFVAANPEP